MITHAEIQGNWNQIKGALMKKWGELTDDELCKAKGNAGQLVGMIQKRTGETKEAVESFLDSAMDNGAGMFSHAAEQAREYASDIGQAAQDQYAHAANAVSDGMEYAQGTVKRRPVESVAVCFGVGLLAGAVLGLMFRNKA